MAELQPGRDPILKQIISTYRCRVCRRRYDQEHVRIAARHEQLWIVGVRCALCRTQQVFWVAMRDTENESLLRDVSGVEEEQFASMAPVTSDEVLDMHEFLQGFDGNFRALFTP